MPRDREHAGAVADRGFHDAPPDATAPADHHYVLTDEWKHCVLLEAAQLHHPHG